MTKDQIEAFIAVVESGGIREASKRLFKSQPAVTKLIQNLELALDLELFDRKSYRTKLKEKNKDLLMKAYQIRDAFVQMEEKAHQVRSQDFFELVLAIDYLCPFSKVQKVISEFDLIHEQNKIHLKFEVLGGTCERLVNGDANIGITPFIHQPERFTFEKLCNLELLPVIASSCADGQNSPGLESFPQVIVNDSSKNEASKIATKTDLKAKTLTVSDHLMKRELILQGLGWGHLEKHSIESELSSGKLTPLLEKAQKTTTLELFLLCLRDKARSQADQFFWDAIKHEFETMHR